MDADEVSIPETLKISGMGVSRTGMTPAAVTEPAISVVQSEVGSRTNERTQEETSESSRTKTTNPTDFEIGYLAGLVDGEGYIYMHYNKNNNRTTPVLAIYCTSKPIIGGACKIMDANPYARRENEKLLGWTACVQGKKALDILHRIAPLLTDPSKECRASKVLKLLESDVNLRGRHPSSEVFVHCPPPVRSRVQKLQMPPHHLESQRETALFGKELTLDKPPVLQETDSEIPIEKSMLDLGWLCGMVDGEGYVHIRYRRDRDSMYPRMRLFAKTKQIMDTAARLMGVNPYARRKHGNLDGWYASVSHRKALNVLRIIGPRLLEPSKRCRAQKILEAFGEVGTIHSRLDSNEFFRDCPPPSRMRKSGTIINSQK
jgi:hypothetical protein